MKTHKAEVKENKACDLCGLPVNQHPVIREIDGEQKAFCCQGCARVYEVAHEQGMLEQAKPKKKSNPLTEIGFNAGEARTFSIEGMWCAGCATAAEHVLRSYPGVKSAEVSFAAERGRLQYDPAAVDPDELIKSLDQLGYQTRMLDDAADQAQERAQERTLLQLITAAAFGMQVMLLYFVQLYPLYISGEFNTPEVRRLEYVVWALATPVLLVGGWSFLKGAWRALRARTATMDTLVALGTLSAYSYSAYLAVTGGGEVYFDSVVMITTFVMFGRYLETLGGSRARKDIRSLLTLQPDQAWLRRDGVWESTKAWELKSGDRILIKPGERVPADAEILEGQAALSEALLTGESVPVNKGPGNVIYAGTLVTDDALIAQVTHPARETRLAEITRIVDQTLATKPPIQRLADRASAYFALGIIAAAVLTFLGWWLIGGQVPEAVLAAVAVLVVACPCALGLATPLALTVSLGRITREGILVRNPVALETAAKLERVVFDKTGTLTRGEMQVVSVEPASGGVLQPEELLRAAAAVEQFSEHPIAKAIVQAYRSQSDRTLPEARDPKLLRGMGASARLEEFKGRRLMVGSDHFVGVPVEHTLRETAEKSIARGDIVIWVGFGDEMVGLIVLRDEPNPSAAQAVAALRRAGIEPVLLSGDHPETAQAVAEDVGIEIFEGRCPPDVKGEQIAGWQTSGMQIAMVGDGVNDAPALAQADLSIAMAGGTDVAGETSDVLLTRDDLLLVPWLIERARRTRRIILENLGWAFAYNLAAVPLAAFGLISPVIAAAAMAMSSLLVVANSLRLRGGD